MSFQSYFGIGASLLSPPSLILPRIAACLIGPVLKKTFGLYASQAHSGMLHNTRRQLLNDNIITDHIRIRYKQLGDAFKNELAFIEALKDKSDLTHFSFSIHGGNNDVLSELAAQLLEREIVSESFNLLEDSENKE